MGRLCFYFLLGFKIRLRVWGLCLLGLNISGSEDLIAFRGDRRGEVVLATIDMPVFYSCCAVSFGAINYK